MSLSPRKRFAQLLATLFLCLAFGIMALWVHERSETRQILEQSSAEHARNFDRALALAGRSLAQFATDYSQWTETVNFLGQPAPDPAWAEINLRTSLANFDVTAAWIYRADGSAFYGTAEEPTAGVPPPELTPEIIRALFHRGSTAHFFLPAGEGVIEVRGAGIVPSEDANRITAPHGFLLAARLWDRAHLTDLAGLTGCQVEFASSPPVAPDAKPEHSLHFERALRDWRGQTVRLLYVTYVSRELAQLAESDAWEALIFLAYGALVIGCVVYYAERWVIGPIIRIGESLTTGRLEPIQGLYDMKSEMGRIARMVRSWFQDREALRVTLEERARLGRDLHDGVIQTLYASGMSLSSARALLRQDPGAAESLLEQTHAEINATIRDVRNFLVRLEPVALEQRQFGDAVHSLAEFMQALRPARITVEIDTELAETLSIACRAQLLHIVREALSNALRHGEAQAITIRLGRHTNGAELRVSDNGRGFDPAQVAPGGHGLGNFAERARELAGSLDIQSQSGHGTLIILRFPFPFPP